MRKKQTKEGSKTREKVTGSKTLKDLSPTAKQAKEVKGGGIGPIGWDIKQNPKC